jgi:hypothetical protein
MAAGWYRPSPQAEVIRSFGAIMAASMGAAMVPAVGSEQWVRDTEHELMIAGHEIDCAVCIRERYTVGGDSWAPGSTMDQAMPWLAERVREAIDSGESR